MDAHFLVGVPAKYENIDKLNKSNNEMEDLKTVMFSNS